MKRNSTRERNLDLCADFVIWRRAVQRSAFIAWGAEEISESELRVDCCEGAIRSLYIIKSSVRRTMGCCISSRSFFTMFNPYTQPSKFLDRLANKGAPLAYSKCSNLETM